MGDGVAGWRTRNDDADDDDDDDEGDRARRESVESAAVGHCGYIRLYPAATREPVSSTPPTDRPTDRQRSAASSPGFLSPDHPAT